MFKKASFIASFIMLLSFSTLGAATVYWSGYWSQSGNDWNGYIQIDSTNNTGSHDFTFTIPGSSESITLGDGGYYLNTESYGSAQGSFTGSVSTTSSNHTPSLID